MMSRSSMSLLFAAALFGSASGFGASAQTTTPSGPGAAANDAAWICRRGQFADDDGL